MDTGKSALGMDGNLAAALGYPIGIIAIISLIMEKENRFVKFHALQEILLYVVFIVVWIAMLLISVILGVAGMAASSAGSAGGAVSGLLSLVLLLVWLVVIVALLGGLIMAAVKAYGGNEFKLPIIGNMAAKFANK